MGDIYGISTALLGCASVYFRGARRTGRTTAMLGYIKSGDRVVFLTRDEARLFERQCKDRGIDGVETIVAGIGDPTAVLGRSPARGRVVYDHRWVEEYYLTELQRAPERLRRLATEAGGYGEAHVATSQQAEATARWK